MFENIKIIKQNDPAAKSYLEIILCYPGLHALIFHSVAHPLYKMGVPLIPRLLNTIARFLTGVDIHPGAKISAGIMIDHGMGVVIGETAEIGSGCFIYQGVTLGGTGKDSGKRHPTLKNNVVVGAGAKVLGNITIENNVRIGAGSVVVRDIPANCTVVGIPGRVVRSADSPTDQEHMLDHGGMPDPTAKVFSILLERIETMQREIVEISKDREKKTPKNIDETNKILHEYIYGDGI